MVKIAVGCSLALAILLCLWKLTLGKTPYENNIEQREIVAVTHASQPSNHGKTGYKYPFQDPSLDWDVRVEDLVGRLSLQEVTDQTLAIYGKYTPSIERLGIKPYVWITECIHGEVNTNATAFPHSIGLAASFRYSVVIAYSFHLLQ